MFVIQLVQNMKKLLLTALFFLCCTVLNAEENVLLFKPYTAGIFEPRIGSVINLTDDNLRLDIGASFDLFRDSTSSNFIWGFGGDFFTYTRLRSENNFKFPVETSDYYFGVNSSTKFKIGEADFASRLRIAHISSHLVDGFSKDGIFIQEPFVYSREFFDISFAYLNNTDLLDYRVFLGAIYVFSTQPDNLNKFIPYFGLDINKKFTDFMELSCGMDLRSGENNMNNLSAQLGLNFKFFKDFGIFVGYYKYYGNSMHGMFYDEKDNYDGIGFQIIYF